MRLPAIHALCLAAMVAGLAGCQSASRWAWWKPKEAAPDASVVARSAAPALPSSQSTPQAADVLQPAAPPSSANLAAAGTKLETPTTTTPAPSSSTIANAPLASYPSVPSSPVTTTPNVPSVSPTADSAKLPALATSGVAPKIGGASVPSAGPYDPNGYTPSTTLAASPTTDNPAATSETSERYATPLTDRYATTPTNPVSSTAPTGPADAPTATAPAAPAVAAASPATTPSADRYAMPATAPAPTAPTTGDRYAQADAERYSSAPATPTVAPTAITAAIQNPVTLSPAPAPTDTVNLSAPAGQYRPGGTSSYPGSTSTPQVEVASRPAPATSTQPPVQAVESTGNSVPWTPPATTLPTTVPGTRTY